MKLLITGGAGFIGSAVVRLCLKRQLATVAERERELKRERVELDQRRAETIAKEDALRTRDEAAGARERDLRASEIEIERVQARLQERAEAVAARETSTESRLSKLEAELADREASLAAWEERVRSQADRAERERAGHGRASQEAFALMAELERREDSLKLREAELAQAVSLRDTDTRNAAEREELVARGEEHLVTLRDELDSTTAGDRVLIACHNEAECKRLSEVLAPEDAQKMYDETAPDGKRRYTVAQIAAEFGVTRPTIYRHLQCLPSA